MADHFGLQGIELRIIVGGVGEMVVDDMYKDRILFFLWILASRYIL